VTDVRENMVSRRQFGRWLLVLACLGVTVTPSSNAWAQNKDKKPPANKQTDPKVAEGEGEDAAQKEPVPLKLEVDALIVPGIIMGVISLLWACSSVWIVKDARRQGLGSKKWKKIVVAPYAVLAVGLLACVGLNWTDYAFLEAGGLSLGVGLLAAVWLMPLVLYLVARNRALNDTGEVVAAPPEVTLVATCREVPEENALLVEKLSENAEIRDLIKILADGVFARTPSILLDLAQGGLHVRHDIDGVKLPVRILESGSLEKKSSKNNPEIWGDASPVDGVIGEKILVMLLRLAGLSPKKRGRPQEGSFLITADGKERACQLRTKIIKGHEQFVVDLATPPPKFKTAEDLGMPAAMLEQLQQLVNLQRGLVIVTAPSGNGLSTLLDMTVTAADRLMRDFVSIEEAHEATTDIQNVKVQKYDLAAGETAVEAVEKAALSYPSGFVIRQLADPELAADLVKRALEDKMVIVSVPAEDSLDAISKILDLGISPSDLARCYLGSVCQKLVRKLCPRCAEEQETPLPLLDKFGKSAEEVPHIKTASPHGGCRFCSGRGYLGRTGAFELATGMPLKKEIARRAGSADLRKAAAQSGYVPMREQGMDLVLAGVTALEEMQRVFASKKKSQAGRARSRA